MENNLTPNGWPLGLESMNLRLRAGERSQAAAVAAAEPPPQSLHRHSFSFSSFTSSNLDTESTASFFQDQSVPLGRLIGLRPRNRGSLYFPNTVCFDQHQIVPNRRSGSSVFPNTIGFNQQQIVKTHSRSGSDEMSRGLCVPRLLDVIEKISRSKSSSKTVRVFQ
ncbi:unnamed protein product [Ilex paraguariensis]|uniref:Uncharacterized protein n=1 Tax=Ilex paraguariensis TaxID=185542 RepID=A0ABC8ULI8_9AQUA